MEVKAINFHIQHCFHIEVCHCKSDRQFQQLILIFYLSIIFTRSSEILRWERMLVMDYGGDVCGIWNFWLTWSMPQIEHTVLKRAAFNERWLVVPEVRSPVGISRQSSRRNQNHCPRGGTSIIAFMARPVYSSYATTSLRQTWYNMVALVGQCNIQMTLQST